MHSFVSLNLSPNPKLTHWTAQTANPKYELETHTSNRGPQTTNTEAPNPDTFVTPIRETQTSKTPNLQNPKPQIPTLQGPTL